MLHSIKELRGLTVEATDGPIGQVHDFYFDDQHWALRFLVVDTGAWLDGRKVLISPMAIGKADWSGRRLPVSLTRERVRHSPDIDTQKPVSRQHEVEQYAYYGYANPWGGPGVWRNAMHPGIGGPDQARLLEQQLQLQRQRGDDPHLRGCAAVIGYHVHAIDGELGHIDGFVLDDTSWLIRYLVVNTSDWWLGHDVLVAPQWIDGISWLDATVSVNLTRRAIRDAPAYDAGAPPDPEHERSLWRHHGRREDWIEGEASPRETLRP